MSYYQHHVFICTNQRDPGEACCQDFDTKAARNYLKSRCKELGIHDAGKVRINNAGCLGRCSEGPVLVVYPQGVWYTFVDREDLDEIIERHLRQGEVVERLRLDAVPK